MSADVYPAPSPRRSGMTSRRLQLGVVALGAPVVLVGALHPVRSSVGARWTQPAEMLAAPVLRAAFGGLAPEVSRVQPAATAPAPPFVMKAKSAAERARAVQCLANAVYYEAALEPQDGQRAVAQVVLNRVRNLNFPHSICGVVYQGWERPTGCQFSFTCDGSLSRAPVPAIMARARGVAEQALQGYVMAAVGTATHYHATSVDPWWRPTVVRITQVGAHIFYRWPGAAGLTPAFGQRYEGGELKLDQAVINGTAPRPLSLVPAPPLPLIQTVAAAANVAVPNASPTAALFQDRPGAPRVHSTLLMNGERPRASHDQVAAINAMLEQRLPSRKPDAGAIIDPLANPPGAKLTAPRPAAASSSSPTGE